MKVLEINKLRKELDGLKKEIDSLGISKDEKLFMSYYIDELKDELEGADEKIENWIKKEIQRIKIYVEKRKGDIE